MPVESAHVKGECKSQALREKWMFWERTARFAVSPKASSHGSEKPRTHGSSYQPGTSAQQTTAVRGSGKAPARVALSSHGRVRQASQMPAAVEARRSVQRRKLRTGNEL